MKIITLTNNVVISDPCYKVPEHIFDNVLPGKFHIFIDDDNTEGIIRQIEIIHTDYLGYNNKIWTELDDGAGVDSGQLGIFNLDTYRNDSIQFKPTDTVFDYEKEIEGDLWYENVTKLTFSDERWGLYDNGVVSSSGYGDGNYPIEICENNQNKIIGIRITFFDDSFYFEEDEE